MRSIHVKLTNEQVEHCKRFARDEAYRDECIADMLQWAPRYWKHVSGQDNKKKERDVT